MENGEDRLAVWIVDSFSGLHLFDYMISGNYVLTIDRPLINQS